MMKKLEKNWIDTVSKSLASEGGEIKLTWEVGEVTIDILSDETEPVRVNVLPDDSLELFIKSSSTKISREEFLDTVIEELNENYGYNLKRWNYENKNMLKNLLKLKHSLKESGSIKGI